MSRIGKSSSRLGRASVRGEPAVGEVFPVGFDPDEVDLIGPPRSSPEVPRAGLTPGAARAGEGAPEGVRLGRLFDLGAVEDAFASASLFARTVKRSLQNGAATMLAQLAQALLPKDLPHAPAPACLERGPGSQDPPGRAWVPQAVRGAASSSDPKQLQAKAEAHALFDEAQTVVEQEVWRAERIEAAAFVDSAALRVEDALAPRAQCLGVLVDGGRCVRLPIEGSSFCLEHAERLAGSPVEAFVSLEVLGALETRAPSRGRAEDEGRNLIDHDPEGDPTDPSAPVVGSVITD